VGVARIEQDARLVADPWEDILRDMSGDAYPTADGKGEEERISSAKILRDYLKIDADKQTDATTKRLSNVMKRLGWEKPPHPLRFGNNDERAPVLRGFRRPKKT
jgi:hypothetical protein